jgi:hypothetical protein
VTPESLPLPRPSGARSLPHRAERGTSFVELMLAALVVATTVVASNSSLRASTEVYHYFADGAHEALMLAQEIHEAALLLPWEGDSAADPLFGDDVYEFDDLDEMTFDPPRSAQYDVVASHVGWSQEVEIRAVDLDDPSVEVDPLTFVGDTLTELVVTIRADDEEVGEFTWWMTDPDSD